MIERRHAVTGAMLMISGAVIFWIAEAIAIHGWTVPPYSLRFNVLSDLGNPVPHDHVFGHAVNSPWYFMMNLGFVAQGILYAAAVLLLSQYFKGWPKLGIRVFSLLEALGLTIAAIFHQQSTNSVEMGVHIVGAGLILMGAFAVMLIGAFGGQVGAPRAYRILSVVMGIIIFLSFSSFITAPRLAVAIGAGVVERVSMWGVLVWQLITGGMLLFATGRRGELRDRAAGGT